MDSKIEKNRAYTYPSKANGPLRQYTINIIRPTLYYIRDWSENENQKLTVKANSSKTILDYLETGGVEYCVETRDNLDLNYTPIYRDETTYWTASNPGGDGGGDYGPILGFYSGSNQCGISGFKYSFENGFMLNYIVLANTNTTDVNITVKTSETNVAFSAITAYARYSNPDYDPSDSSSRPFLTVGQYRINTELE